MKDMSVQLLMEEGNERTSPELPCQDILQSSR